MFTYQLDSEEEVQAAELKDFDDYVEQTKFAPRHWADVKVAIDSLPLKQNNTMSISKKMQLE